MLGTGTITPDKTTEMGGRDPAVMKAYLVGGGIASLSAAAFMIRDGDVLGHNITIFEELGILGGSLDGSGSSEAGYVLRGGRMLESKYLCTFDLFASIPALSGVATVTDEIFAWNETMKTSSKSRLFRDGQRQTAPKFGLSERHILTIERLALEPEGLLGRTTIADQFSGDFFKTDFWFMWCTTFAFQPWHSAVEFKRYLVRFVHMVSGFERLEGIMRTPYNQYDSMVRPLQKWLEQHGVNFKTSTRVTNLEFDCKTVCGIVLGGTKATVPVAPTDLVIVTLGSMTEASSLGTMEEASAARTKADGGAWRLWETIATNRPEFGRPGVFADHVDASKWVSFTTTLHDATFLDLVRDLTGNVPGEGGLITFPQSAWLASIVIPSQPHFIGQPEDVAVFWGYGLSVDTPGDFVKKPMAACSGREIMIKILGHLRIGAEAAQVLAKSICIPCMMPLSPVSSYPVLQATVHRAFQRAIPILPLRANFAKSPMTVFTVEYSIRSAQMAVYGMLEVERTIPAVYKGKFDPRVLYHAYKALHDLRP